MTKNKFKAILILIAIIFLVIFGLIIFNSVTENVRAGYVGYKYDRTIRNGEEGTISGTSVINQPLTGLVFVNPFTQEILKYPTTIVAKNWTQLDEGDNPEDMSMQVGSEEGKNIVADVYVSVRPNNMSKIISSFGMKTFDEIVDDDVYGLVKGKLSIVAQSYSIYDVQASRSKIQEETFKLLTEVLNNLYGIELVRFEIGTLILPTDIQTKIDQKTEAINAVELAKLDRQKQDETNQKIVDQQKAESQRDLIRRQQEADAAAYEKEKAASAQVLVAESNVEVAGLKVKEAELNKQAELEKQKSYTPEYFHNKELEVQRDAVKAINPSVKTIITDSSGSGYSALYGLKEVLDSIE
jgi:regulator of protease activity HflC (stomatin/prohibitin superfamily)